MTKKDLTKEIYDVIDHDNFMCENKETILENIETLLNTLLPRNAKSFAKWGQPCQQVSIDKCWV
jgi:hypothetical protein